MNTFILNPRKVVTTLLGVSLAMFVFAILSIANPGGQAYAATCPPLNICGGTGGDGGGTGTGGGGNPGGTGSGGGSDGGSSAGGGGGDYDPYGYTERRMPDWAGGGLACPVRDDGKASIGADYHFTKKFDYGTSPTNPPRGENGWVYSGYFPSSGYLYEMTYQAGRTCLYPPRSHFISVVCSINFNAQVRMELPKAQSYPTVVGGTGYSEGSSNYLACLNSKGDASVRKGIVQYGYYGVYVWQRAQVARVEIFDEVDIRTGSVPAPNIVSLSPAYTTLAARTSSVSLDCLNGWSPTGIRLTGKDAYTEELCKNTSAAAAVCSARPVKFQEVLYSDFGLLSKQGEIRSFADRNFTQQDKGELTKVLFDQSISGKGIKVNSYETQFFRDSTSTPWDKTSQWDKNYFELRQRWNGASVLSQGSGTSTPVYGGIDNEIFTFGLTASAPGIPDPKTGISKESSFPTKITQDLHWKGTRLIQSGTITSINGATGSVSYTPTMINVPTSGHCNQLVTLEYIRPIGDKVS